MACWARKNTGQTPGRNRLDATWGKNHRGDVMTQREFNRQVIAILWRLAARVDAARYSEPKHGIIGDEIADMIVVLEEMDEDA